MKVLFFGDIVGKPGRQALAKTLPVWKKKFKPDFVIANGENLAHGDGVTSAALEEVISSGIDAVTSGNHIFSRKEAVSLLEDASKRLIRPHNISGKNIPGRGWLTAEKTAKRLVIANLIGITQFRPHKYENPFIAAEELLKKIRDAEPAAPIILDFHAEATSEKKAMGWFLDGKVSAVIGTHTHVPTRDERILPGGTAYITDIGMVGPYDSVLGLDAKAIINNFLTEPRSAIEIAGGAAAEANAVVLEINEKNKWADSIIHIRKISEI